MVVCTLSNLLIPWSIRSSRNIPCCASVSAPARLELMCYTQKKVCRVNLWKLHVKIVMTVTTIQIHSAITTDYKKQSKTIMDQTPSLQAQSPAKKGNKNIQTKQMTKPEPKVVDSPSRSREKSRCSNCDESLSDWEEHDVCESCNNCSTATGDWPVSICSFCYDKVCDMCKKSDGNSSLFICYGCEILINKHHDEISKIIKKDLEEQ